MLRQIVIPDVVPVYAEPLGGPCTLIPCRPLPVTTLSQTVADWVPSSTLIICMVLADPRLRAIIIPVDGSAPLDVWPPDTAMPISRLPVTTLSAIVP